MRKKHLHILLTETEIVCATQDGENWHLEQDILNLERLGLTFQKIIRSYGLQEADLCVYLSSSHYYQIEIEDLGLDDNQITGLLRFNANFYFQQDNLNVFFDFYHKNSNQKLVVIAAKTDFIEIFQCACKQAGLTITYLTIAPEQFPPLLSPFHHSGINLLPWREQHRHNKYVTRRMLAIFVISLGFILILVIYSYLAYQKHALQKHLKALNKEKNALTLEYLKISKEKILKNPNLFLQTNPNAFRCLLYGLGEQKPEEITLTYLNIASHLNIIGYSTELSLVKNYKNTIEALCHLKKFSKITLDPTKNTFEIEISE